MTLIIGLLMIAAGIYLIRAGWKKKMFNLPSGMTVKQYQERMENMDVSEAANSLGSGNINIFGKYVRMVIGGFLLIIGLIIFILSFGM